MYRYIYIYGTVILTFFLAYTLTFYLTFCLTSILNCFLTYTLTFFLAFYLASILTFYLASFQALILAYVPTFYLTFFLCICIWHIFWHSFWHSIYLVYLRGFFVVEARWGTLRSSACSWSPAGRTLIQRLLFGSGRGTLRPSARLQLKSGGEHSAPEFARRGTLRSSAWRLLAGSGREHCYSACSWGPTGEAEAEAEEKAAGQLT